MTEFKRKLASVMVIDEVFPIPNADKLELVRLDGWKAVVQKDKFKVGDKVVYVETDSLLPIDKEEFNFMEQRKFRVKQIKLRGQISDGLVFQMNELISYKLNPKKYDVGDDLTDVLGIKHYQKLAEEQSVKNPKVKKKGFKWYWYNFKVKLIEMFLGNIGALGPWPGYCPKSDEPQIRHVYNTIKHRYLGTKCEVREKLHGKSVSIYFYNGKSGVCSRNYELICRDKQESGIKNQLGQWLAKKLDVKIVDSSSDDYWVFVKENKVIEKVKSVYGDMNIAIQLELCGPNINGNMYKFDKLRGFVFNVWDIDNKKYWNGNQVDEFCNKTGLERVPFLGYIDLHDDLDKYISDCSVRSTMGDCVMEGHVIRPIEEINDPNIGRLSFKCISPLYKQMEDKTLGLE